MFLSLAAGRQGGLGLGDTGKRFSGEREGRVQCSRQRAERTTALLGSDPGSGLSATTRHRAFLKLELQSDTQLTKGMTIKKILRVKITTGTFSAGRKGDSSTGYKPHITGNIQVDVMLFHGGSGTRFGHPAPCAGSGLGGEVPQSARLWRRPGPPDALTPCAPLPVLLPHVQQLLHAVVHGFGELADSITLLFSVGQRHEEVASLTSLPTSRQCEV